MYQLLIVDDEPLVQAGIRSMLNWNEMNIEICGTAMNGQAALKIIEEKSTDIVITDIKMPVMNGLDAARAIRSGKNPLGRTIPIIAMTANAFNEDVQSCLAAGMTAHISKPIDIAALERIMQKLQLR